MNVEEAARLIKQGKVVAFPTETVYGLGGSAGDPEAVRKIFEIKGRPDDNPLIVHLSDISEVTDFVPVIPEPAKKLMEQCWPGPLTIIFQKKPDVLDAITSGLPTVALRIPNHPLALELIRLTGPIVAPSANRSGRPSPTKAEHVFRDLGEDFPVVDGGESDIGLESTVLDVSQIPFAVLRPGRYTPEQLAGICGTEVVIEKPDVKRPRSPGVKYTHYKPAAAIQWLTRSVKPDKKKTLLITHTIHPSGFPHHRHFNGDFNLMARQLYDLFRSADYKELSSIIIEPLPPDHAHPLIAALKNRIEKAIG